MRRIVLVSSLLFPLAACITDKLGNVDEPQATATTPAVTSWTPSAYESLPPSNTSLSSDTAYDGQRGTEPDIASRNVDGQAHEAAWATDTANYGQRGNEPDVARRYGNAQAHDVVWAIDTANYGQRGNEPDVARRYGNAQAHETASAINASSRNTALPEDFWFNEARIGSPVDQRLSAYVRASGRFTREALGRVALASLLRPRASVVENRLVIHGDLVIQGSQFAEVYTLPDALTVRGALDISTTDITSLPSGLNVFGTLTLPRTLTHLPFDLHVGGDLDARLCRSLTGSSNMRVSGRFRTSRAENATARRDYLEQASAQARAEANFDYYLRTLYPQQFGRYTPASSGFNGGSGLYGTWNLQRPSRPTPSAAQQITEVIDEWRRFSTPARPTIDPASWNMSASDAAAIATFSQKLREAPQYASTQGRAMMGNLMLDMFRAMHQDAEYRATTVIMIAAAITACGDRALDTLNQIEGSLVLRQASSGDISEADLYQLGLRFLKLDVVRRIARDHANDSGTAEQIEVVLAFESRLTERLNLPITARNMLYERCAELEDEDYTRAARRATQATEDPATREAFFLTWTPWQEHLRRKAVSQFDYASLPVRDWLRSTIDANQICPLTQEAITDLAQPICFGDSPSSPIYEAEAFLQWWGLHGTEPAYRQSVEFDTLQRVHIVEE